MKETLAPFLLTHNGLGKEALLCGVCGRCFIPPRYPIRSESGTAALTTSQASSTPERRLIPCLLLSRPLRLCPTSSDDEGNAAKLTCPNFSHCPLPPPPNLNWTPNLSWVDTKSLKLNEPVSESAASHRCQRTFCEKIL